MEATIRISSEGERKPAGGFAGALGGTTPGVTEAIEVDLRDATGGDITVMLPEIAQAYATAFVQPVASVTLGSGAITVVSNDEIPFPEAGDPHPFGDRDVEPPIQGSMTFYESGDFGFTGTVTRERVLAALDELDEAAQARAEWQVSQGGTPKNDGDPRKSVVVFLDALQADPVRLSSDEHRLLSNAIRDAL